MYTYVLFVCETVSLARWTTLANNFDILYAQHVSLVLHVYIHTGGSSTTSLTTGYVAASVKAEESNKRQMTKYHNNNNNHKKCTL